MSNEFIEKVLNIGQVPIPLSHEIERSHLISKLAEQLQNCARESGKNWLVVHGFPGSGKSRLVADTLRRRPEFVGHFFERVHWIVDNSTLRQLGTVMTDLLCRLNCNELTKFSSDESRIYGLREIIKEQLQINPKTLLIFDGVQTEECVKFCSGLPCPIIFTTCVTDIFSEVENRISEEFGFFKLGKKEEFTLPEIRELASKFGFNLTSEGAQNLKVNGGNNPALIIKLLNSAKANPWMIQMYAENPPSQPMENFRYKSSYSYRSLAERIDSLLPLVETSTFNSFTFCGAVLAPDEWIRTEIFKLIWPVDSCGVESETELIIQMLSDIDELVSKSLIEKDDDETTAELLKQRLRNKVVLAGRNSDYGTREGIIYDYYEGHSRQLESLIKKSRKESEEKRLHQSEDIQVANPVSWIQWLKGLLKFEL
ncbi:hypothetical protein FO519_002114 [Halicephalobus sp. NKZ332]|nr:hypothetical protein FO519_002114 [Halicephalobus sp. NKZ332]